MRAAVILLAMAVTASLIPGMQCVVKCAEPAGIPPCHRSSGKPAPIPRENCESVMMAGESAVLRSAAVGVDSGYGAILPDIAAPLSAASTQLKLASFRHLPPPLDARHIVLRI